MADVREVYPVNSKWVAAGVPSPVRVLAVYEQDINSAGDVIVYEDHQNWVRTTSRFVAAQSWTEHKPKWKVNQKYKYKTKDGYPDIKNTYTCIYVFDDDITGVLAWTDYCGLNRASERVHIDLYEEVND